MELERIAESVNTLGAFLGIRDVPALTQEALSARLGVRQADVMVLFGGSILCGGDVLAGAMKKNVAKRYVIVGGEGHTTQTLREKMHGAFPAIETAGLPEAEVFAAYLRWRYALTPDWIECASTNCGNNITNLLGLLQSNGVSYRSVILSQDATMQRRMEAGLRKHAEDIEIVNFAVYQAEVSVRLGELAYEKEILGMWEMDRYISLLMGEIPRLTDDALGYGPRGQGFIAHVDIPQPVREAFTTLQQVYQDGARTANPAYATQKL